MQHWCWSSSATKIHQTSAKTIGQDFFAFGQKLETFLKRYRNCKLSTNPAHIAKQTVMFVIAQTLHRVKIAWNSTKMDLKSMAFISSKDLACIRSLRTVIKLPKAEDGLCSKEDRTVQWTLAGNGMTTRWVLKA